MTYQKMTEHQKRKLISKLYVDQKQSFGEIAKEYKTYPNKVRRDAIKYGISIRSKSDAQKNVLQQGKANHPTKGKKRSEEEKNKISLGMHQSWNELSDKERNKRKMQSKKNWNNFSDVQKENMANAAHIAIRKTSVEGSKLEKFLLKKLIENNIKVQFHKEQTLVNTKLQIDLYLPETNTAIEVDGPSHFAPVWGQDSLSKNKKYDQKKTGLILGKGMKLIRIQQTGDYSNARALLLYDQLSKVIDKISNNETTENLFQIKDQ